MTNTIFLEIARLAVVAACAYYAGKAWRENRAFWVAVWLLTAFCGIVAYFKI